MRFILGRREDRGESWLRVEAEPEERARRELGLFTEAIERRLERRLSYRGRARRLVRCERWFFDGPGLVAALPYALFTVALPRRVAEPAIRGALRDLGIDPERSFSGGDPGAGATHATDRRELVVEIEKHSPTATIDDLPSIRDELTEALATELDDIVQIASIEGNPAAVKLLVATIGHVLGERDALPTFSARVEASEPIATQGPGIPERGEWSALKKEKKNE